MVWHPHLNIGIHESGSYTVRRVVQGYETWFKRGTTFLCLSRDQLLQSAKQAAEAHAKGQK
jgi:hypothetical protein